MAELTEVRGLHRFQEAFAAFADQYVLIGGTAAMLTMDEAGQRFRATKDLDIVLHIEALTPAFGRAFWAFVHAGGYALRERSAGTPCFYRFHTPTDLTYPAQLELFSRKPDALVLSQDAHLTPIPVAEEVSSLSAILLDDAYYGFIMAGRRTEGGLVWIGEDRLIPLKARACLDLRARIESGAVDQRSHANKHRNDVVRLAQLLTAETRIDLPELLAQDLHRFVGSLRADTAVHLKNLGLRGTTLNEICDRLLAAYGLV